MLSSYVDRYHAGQVLAEHLSDLADQNDVLVLGLPRGGVPVAYEIARRIHAPLDVFVVRKLGAPGQPELAVGAVATGGVRVINDAVVRSFRLDPADLDVMVRQAQEQVVRQERLFRPHGQTSDVDGKHVILVDDGLATGSTMRAAVQAVRYHQPVSITVAVGVAAPWEAEAFARSVDRLICPLRPDDFTAVGGWYDRFDQTSDAEVRHLLEYARNKDDMPHPQAAFAPREGAP
ncbi:MAG: phosphoribosyltransferase [Phycisphaerae bacterium]